MKTPAQVLLAKVSDRVPGREPPREIADKAVFDVVSHLKWLVQHHLKKS
jgi:hypothetical protein